MGLLLLHYIVQCDDYLWKGCGFMETGVVLDGLYLGNNFPNMIMCYVEDVLFDFMWSLYIIILDGPRSNMVTFLCIWLVSFLTMLGDSFLTWLDLCYCVDCLD